MIITTTKNNRQTTATTKKIKGEKKCVIRENINVNDIKGEPVHVELMNPFAIMKMSSVGCSRCASLAVLS